MLRIRHCLDSLLTNGSKVLSPTHRPCLLPRNIFLLQGLVRLEGLSKFKKFIYLMGYRTPDLAACSIVPQPLRYHVASLG
jgi:hypothetical protein